MKKSELKQLIKEIINKGTTKEEVLMQENIELSLHDRIYDIHGAQSKIVDNCFKTDFYKGQWTNVRISDTKVVAEVTVMGEKCVLFLMLTSRKVKDVNTLFFVPALSLELKRGGSSDDRARFGSFIKREITGTTIKYADNHDYMKEYGEYHHTFIPMVNTFLTKVKAATGISIEMTKFGFKG